MATIIYNIITYNYFILYAAIIIIDKICKKFSILKSLYSIFIGFIFASSTIWNVSLNFIQSFAWIIGAIVAFIIYYLLASK